MSNAPPHAPGELAEIKHRAFAESMRAWGENDPNPEWFADDCLGMMLADCGRAGALIDTLLDEIASLRSATGDGGEAKEPPPGLLMSMALRYDHGIGAPVMVGDRERRARELDCILTLMSQLWEEVAGQGFYRPEKEADYAAMAERIRLSSSTKIEGAGEL